MTPSMTQRAGGGVRPKIYCGVCGAANSPILEVEQYDLNPDDFFYYPNTRMKFFMSTYLHSCCRCHYAAHDIAAAPQLPRAFFETEFYRGCFNMQMTSQAQTYFRSSLVESAIGRYMDAYTSLVQAAWLCEEASALAVPQDISGNVAKILPVSESDPTLSVPDLAAGDVYTVPQDNAFERSARECRLRALSLFTAACEDVNRSLSREVLHIIRAELLRRTGQFSLLMRDYQNFNLQKYPKAKALLEYEISLAMQADDAIHSKEMEAIYRSQ